MKTQETKIRSLSEKTIAMIDSDTDPYKLFDKLLVELLRVDFHAYDDRRVDFWFLNVMGKMLRIHKQER